MSEIKVTIKNWSKITKAFGKFPQITAKYMNEAIKLAILEIQRTTTPLVPVSEGKLRGSIFTEFGVLKGVLGFNSDYAVYVHEGTRPHFPPFGPGTSVNRWSSLHGINPFLVARAISIRGTKPQPFLKEGVGRAQSLIDRRFADALDKIVQEVASQSK
jgi:hypothetical protein